MAGIQLTAKQLSKIKRAIKALNDVRKEIQHNNPDNDINWYLEECNNLNLMEEQPHNEMLKAQHDSVIDVFELDDASGGGW